MKKILFFIASCCFAGLLSQPVESAKISEQQIAQFKRLPLAQQQALAKQFGVDLATIQGKKTTISEDNDKAFKPKGLYPRGTLFDDNGQPVLDENGEPILADEFEQLDKESTNKDSEQIKPFGYDAFANAPASFVASSAMAIPANYQLGAGDSLSIQIFGKENIDYQLDVTREGQIVIPSLGAYRVAGMTFDEAKRFLTSRIKDKILGVDAVISLAKLRSIRVFVLGEAFKPGAYSLSSLASITHALFAAGGFSDIGSLRNIQLKRAGTLIKKLDLYDLLINGDSSADITLQDGDVVFISPVGARVTVKGEVTRPAIYEVTQNETFKDIIAMAGGTLPSAYPKASVVERYNQQNLRTILNLDLSNKAFLDKPVQDGDVLTVAKTSEQFDQSVTLIGAVARPGKYQWLSGQHITDVIQSIHSDVLQIADLNYSLIVREKNIGREIEVLQFSLTKALANKSSTDNITLQARDKIIVFSRIEKREKSLLGLDMLAKTQEQLLDEAKEEAKSAYQTKRFWQIYGSQKQQEYITEQDESDIQIEKAQRSLENLTGATKDDDLDIRDYHVFSRKRLLLPIIEQLRQQGAAGEPVRLVEIAGAVKYPGVYPQVKNQTVSLLVTAAGGLLESAYLKKAEITRDTVESGKAAKQSIEINLAQAIEQNSAQNLVLQSKDRLNIHNIPAWQENHIVELKGEFLFPGKYTIHRGETLSQLIKRAGGFTDYAYKNGSIFTREKLKQLELKNLLNVAENLRMEIASKSLTQSKTAAPLDYQQARKLLADLTKAKPVGRLVIDLPKVMEQEGYDVLLEDGDVLYVPTKQNSVNVIGQVQVASSHLYNPELSPIDYVRLSGGLKKRADEERIYVIKANGSIIIPKSSNWFSAKVTSLQPGDTVVVPLDSEYMDNISLWTSATQILYQGAVAIAAIGKL